MQSLKTLSMLALVYFVALVATGCGADERRSALTPGTCDGPAQGDIAINTCFTNK